MKQRYMQVAKTLATPTNRHIGVKVVNTGLGSLESFEIPSCVIDSHETEAIGAGAFGTCTKASLHGTPVCVKSYHQSNKTDKKLVVHEALILTQVRHSYICYFVGCQTQKQPFQIVTVFYNVDGISLSVYDAFSHAKLPKNIV